MRAKLCGSKSESDIVIVVESTDGLDLASDVVVFSLREQVFYGGMFLVTTKDLSCLLLPSSVQPDPLMEKWYCLLIRFVHIFHSYNRKIAIVSEVS